MTTKIELINSGPEYFETQVTLIGESKKELHFHTYRFNMDETGTKTAEALKTAARRGVMVYLMLDAFGSSKLSREFIKSLKKEGIYFRYFSPRFSLQGLYVGRRLHHKILVVDGKKALISGINTADKYRGTEQEPPWLDFAVLLDGPVSLQAADICKRLFGRNISLRKWLTPPGKTKPVDEQMVQLIHNDWFRRKIQIYRAYLREVNQAKEQIILTASYFLPGRRFRRALIKAAGRGVKVQLILAGHTDVPLMKPGTTFLYEYFFKYGIEIYEWNESILHGKAMIADGRWCTIGSFNLINLSTYGSIETNVEITDRTFIRHFEKKLISIRDRCTVIDRDDYEKQYNWLKHLRNWLSYKILHRLFFIMTFFSYKRWGSKFVRD